MEINLAIAKPLAVLPGAFLNLFDCIGRTDFQSFLYIPFQLLRNIGCDRLRLIIIVPVKHLFTYTYAQTTAYTEFLIHGYFQFYSSSDSFE